MPSIWRTLPLTVCALLLASAGYPQPTHIEKQLPCESFSESAAVFVGVAGPPVMRWVQLPNHPPLQMKLSTITVERAYVGVTTPVMYLMPLGIERYGTPGQRYLVYGREYRAPDIVMASPGFGAKEIGAATADLAYLETLASGVGGTISGVVQLKDLTYDYTTSAITPLARIVVRISNSSHATEAVSEENGRFSVSVPAGTYQVMPQLPEDLVIWDSTSHIEARVADGGCAVTTIDTRFNGQVRGVLRGPDGRPLTWTSVDLMPIDIEPEPTTGQIKGTSSATTNDKGEFEFTGRPVGRYFLGVNLYNAPNPFGPSYPRTYYPGTTERRSAMPIVVERGHSGGAFDLSIPTLLSKGELDVTVDSDSAGRLKVCFVQLEDLFSRWSSYEARPGTPVRFPVVDGQRYQVHAHLEFPGGHFESEPFVFTATTGKTVVRLRPDAPRTLHR
jgi:hypothetical protein